MSDWSKNVAPFFFLMLPLTLNTWTSEWSARLSILLLKKLSEPRSVKRVKERLVVKKGGILVGSKMILQKGLEFWIFQVKLTVHVERRNRAGPPVLPKR